MFINWFLRWIRENTMIAPSLEAIMNKKYHVSRQFSRFGVSSLLLVFLIAACGEDEKNGATMETRDPWLTKDLLMSCNDIIDSIYQHPGDFLGEKGAILRCAEDLSLSREDLYGYMKENGYEGVPFSSGTTMYRILYKTERAEGQPGIATARLFLPTNPRADRLPVVISLRGAVGIAPKCAASKHNHELEYGDFERQNFSLAGYGYAIFATDLAGFGNYGASGNPPLGYGVTKDVGKSALDGVVAMRNLLGDKLTRKVVLLGQSQGGHSALSALAMSNSPDEAPSSENAVLDFEHYGIDGELAGVAVYAPHWFSQRTWGGLLQLAGLYPFESHALANLSSIWYHYTHGEVLDGEGHGLDIFREELRGGIEQLVDTTCTGSSRVPAMEALGTHLKEVVKTDFYSAVAKAAALTGDCGGNQLCEKWMRRYYSDRPHITGAASQVPILVVYSMRDTTIGPGRLACAFERLADDGVPLEVCIERDRGGHSTIMDIRADYVADWIAATALDAETVPRCDSGGMELFSDIVCEVPPTNE